MDRWPWMNGNGDQYAARDRLAAMLEQMVGNATSLSRSASIFSQLFDNRRSIEDECGYPNSTSISVEAYRHLYDFEPYAARVCQLMPKECWQKPPKVYETEDPTDATEFEQAWDALGSQLLGGSGWYKDEQGSRVWDYLYRADVLSGIGHFGIILLGLDDGKNLQDPVDEVVTINTAGVGDCYMTEEEQRVINEGRTARQERWVGGFDKSGPAYVECPAVPLTANEKRVVEQMAVGRERVLEARHWHSYYLSRMTGRHQEAPQGDSRLTRNERQLIANHAQQLVTNALTANAPKFQAGSADPDLMRPTPPGQSVARQGGGNPKMSSGARPTGQLSRSDGTPGDVPTSGTIDSPFVKQPQQPTPQLGGATPQRVGQSDSQQGRSPSEVLGYSQDTSPGFKLGAPERQVQQKSGQGAAFGGSMGYPPQGGPPPNGGRGGNSKGAKPPSSVTSSPPDNKGSQGATAPGSSLAGTDQQYFGVQYGPSEEFGDPPSGKAKRKLLFLRVFDESLVQIVRYEWNVNNPRFGLPVMYRVTLNDPREQHSGIGLPLATVFVHWSRVVHICDRQHQPGSSEIFAAPRMRPVLYPLLDIRKTRGGAGEGYWHACVPPFLLTTHPQLGGDVEVNPQGLKDSMEQMWNGLQRYGIFTGMDGKTVPPTAPDPTPFIAVHEQAICIKMECPVRVFKGAERGELASSQDDEDWNLRVHSRRCLYITPGIICQFIDRLIQVSVLPMPTVKEPPPQEFEQAQAAMSSKLQQSAQQQPQMGGKPSAPGQPGKPGGSMGQSGKDGQVPPGGPGAAGGGSNSGKAPPFGGSGNGPGQGGAQRGGAGNLSGDASNQPGPSAGGATGQAPGFGKRPPTGNKRWVTNAPPGLTPENEDGQDQGASADDRTASDTRSDRSPSSLFSSEDDSGQQGDGQDQADDQQQSNPNMPSPKYQAPAGYTVEWPDPEALGDKDKAAILLQRTQAYAAYVQGNLESVIPPKHYMTQFDSMEEVEANEILTSAQEAHMGEGTMTMPPMIGGREVAAPPGTQDHADAQAKADQFGAEMDLKHRMVGEGMNPAGEGGQEGPPGMGGEPFGGKTDTEGPPEAKGDDEQTIQNSILLVNDDQPTQGDGRWITLAGGHHVFVGKGVSPSQAIREHFAKQAPGGQQPNADDVRRYARSAHDPGPQHGDVHGEGHDEHDHHGPGASLEHTAHEVHEAHEAHEIGEVAGHALAGSHAAGAMGHEVAAAMGGHAAAHEAAHGAHEAMSHAAGHGFGAGHGSIAPDAHAHGPEDVAAIAARHLYDPALKAARKMVDKVPGGKRVAEGIAKLHDGAHKIADAAVSKMQERYGKATTAAILGSGSLLSHNAMRAVGIPGTVGKALPAPHLIGSIPLLAVAEVGKRMGLVGPGTKLEKAMETAGTWVHALREAVARPFKGVAHAAEGLFLRGARAAGRLVKRLTGNTITVNDDEVTLTQDEIDEAARQFANEIHDQYAELLKQHPEVLETPEDDEDETSDK